jgi:hypothetical protein
MCQNRAQSDQIVSENQIDSGSVFGSYLKNRKSDGSEIFQLETYLDYKQLSCFDHNLIKIIEVSKQSSKFSNNSRFSRRQISPSIFYKFLIGCNNLKTDILFISSIA